MQSITLPQKPKFISIDEKSGKFEIDGCYPGYGMTLGNALRRVLLSSLSGSAITAVKIKGVTHEFSTIPNVLEDVVQIILSLKQIRVRSYKEGSVKLSLKVKGEKSVNAGMIECPSDVEIINKDFHIATITNAKGELDMEIEINSGIGYVPVEQQEKAERELGYIAIDAIYTPIRRVNYIVDNMRVGKRTDFEKITLDVVTDGTTTPQEAFSKAVEILVNQFSVLSELNSDKIAAVEAEVTATEVVEVEEAVKVADLAGLTAKTLNVLEKSGIETVVALTEKTEEELLALEGMGAKGIKEIKKAVSELGLNLK